MTDQFKPYPEGYPSDLVSIIDAFSLSRGKKVEVVGSGAVRGVIFWNDIDSAEEVSFSTLEMLLARVVEVSHALRDHPSVKWNEMKLGEIEDWRLGSEPNRPVSVEMAQERLAEMKKTISPELLEGVEEKLKSDPDSLRRVSRLHVLRWSPGDVLKGYIVHHGATVSLRDALTKDKGMMKLDLTVYLESQQRYIEISIISLVKVGRKYVTLPPLAKGEVAKSLAEDIKYYSDHGRYMKASKRMASLLRIMGDISGADRFRELFNSDAGRASRIANDIDAVINHSENDGDDRSTLEGVRQLMAEMVDPVTPDKMYSALDNPDDITALLPLRKHFEAIADQIAEKFISGTVKMPRSKKAEGKSFLGEGRVNPGVGPDMEGGAHSGGRMSGGAALGRRVAERLVSSGAAGMEGSGFFDDFVDGFKSVIKPFASIAKPLLAAVPHPYAQAASGILGALGAGRGAGAGAGDGGEDMKGGNFLGSLLGPIGSLLGLGRVNPGVGPDMEGGKRRRRAKGEGPKRAMSEPMRLRGALAGMLVKQGGTTLAEASSLIKKRGVYEDVIKRGVMEGYSAEEILKAALSQLSAA